MPDTYADFRDLEAHQAEGLDWRREYLSRGSRILVMAPHGGWIEPFTTELAWAIAGSEFSFYTFQGIKSRGSDKLHLTSHRFDEPVALDAASESQSILAVHGEKSRGRAFTMVGGRRTLLRDALVEALGETGFPVEEPRPGLRGENPLNICNRGRSGAGGQLEISEGLRAVFRREASELERFVEAVRGVILELEVAGDWKQESAGTESTFLGEEE